MRGVGRAYAADEGLGGAQPVDQALLFEEMQGAVNAGRCQPVFRAHAFQQVIGLDGTMRFPDELQCPASQPGQPKPVPSTDTHGLVQGIFPATAVRVARRRKQRRRSRPPARLDMFGVVHTGRSITAYGRG